VPKVFGMIEAVPHEKRLRGIEPDEPELGNRLMLIGLVQQGTDRERSG
jgi:hypothetical protein